MDLIKDNIGFIIGGFLALLGVLSVVLAFAWREVVATNVVHIVQTRKKTTSYGSKQEAGNVYYAFPSYLPIVGLSRIILPVNNFNLDLNNYQAYDKDRVPLGLHVTAFFRIADTNLAAGRVQGFEELKGQLELVVKGAVRKILASHDIHSIMTDRATFGKQFTEEVAAELENWGVVPVKNMELMDIKDVEGSSVIANIMAKKSSHIEMESRVEVATNKQKAETAEIEAARTIELSNIDAKKTTELSAIDAKKITQVSEIQAQQSIGERNAERDKVVGVAKEKANQETQSEAAVTMKKQMDVISVKVNRQAEIDKQAAEIRAAQEAAVLEKMAQGRLAQTKLDAAGSLEIQQKDAEGKLALFTTDATGIRLEGEAKAAAEAALQLAPVTAQITLAKEIGANEGYQTYLVNVRKIEADQAVGTAQAEALKAADIKVIANTGVAQDGLKSVGELFSSNGGAKLGGLLAALENNPASKKVMETLTAQKPSTNGVS